MLSARVEQDDLSYFMQRRPAVFIDQAKLSRMGNHDHEVDVGEPEKIIVQSNRPAAMDGEAIQTEYFRRKIQFA